MQIDRASLEKLLQLNDKKLQAIITQLAVQSGIDPKEFNIDLSDVQSIRKALLGASEDDLKRIVEQYEANKGRKR